MLTLQSLFTIAVLLSQSGTYAEHVAYSEVQAAEFYQGISNVDRVGADAMTSGRVKLGGNWYPIAPEVSNTAELFEGSSSNINLPFPVRAQITFLWPTGNMDAVSYVKRIKIIAPVRNDPNNPSW